MNDAISVKDLYEEKDEESARLMSDGHAVFLPMGQVVDVC
jgi:hypothetical protein